MMLQFRQAKANDLPALVRMLADDFLGCEREDNSVPLNHAYIEAFQAIDKDPNNEILLAVDQQIIVGMLQMTFIPGLTYQGGWRCQIEGVRIHQDYRDQGFGKHILKYAIDLAKKRGCLLVQLTTNTKRTDALRFYERLGFVNSHYGLKLHLKNERN